MSRVTLKPAISKLREIIIKNIAGKMEKYGFDDTGRVVSNKPLSEYDNVIKNNLVSLFKGKNIEGNKKEYIAYIQDSARTFLHILICFKTMEQRGIMGNVVGRLMNDQLYDAVIPDFNNVHPLAFSDLSDKFSAEISIMEEKDSYEEDREYYNFIYMLSALTKEMSKEVPLLFKDYEHNLVHPDFEGLKEILFNINKIDESEYAEDDFLGWIYQYWVDIKDDELKTAKGEKDVSYANSIFYEILNTLEEEQTQFGEFYTPRWVVKYIVDNTLKPYFEDNKKIETIKLLDPACGAGNFLVYAFDVFYELYKIEHPDWSDNHIIGNILGKNIFGVDIQREPLQITAINLWLKAKKKAQDVKIKNLNLFNMNILKANSLYRWENDKEEAIQLSLFQDELEFTERQYTAEDIGQYISSQVFRAKKDAKEFFKNKFNVIVMNPPYLGIRKMNKEMSTFLKKEYPMYKSDLFQAFISRAYELLKVDGKLGVISSDTFLTLDSHENIRSLLLSSFKIHKVIKLGSGVFDGPTVQAAIVILTKSSKTSNNILEYANAEGSIENVIFSRYYQRILKTITGSPFIFDITENVRSLFEKNQQLDNVVEIKQGMITGDNGRFLRFKWEVPESYRNKEWFPYVKGGSGEKWCCDNNEYINWSNDGMEIKKYAKQKYGTETKTIKNQSYFFRSGLTYSDIGGKNFCARLMEENCIFDTTSTSLFMKNDNEYYVLGLMNSKLVNYLLYKLNQSIHFQVCDLQKLPFVNANGKQSETVIELTSKAITLKKFVLGFSARSDYHHSVEIEYGLKMGATSIRNAYEKYYEKCYAVAKELSEIQNKIDKVVYSIYGIESNDVRIIENEFPGDSNKVIEICNLKKAVLNYIRKIAINYIKINKEHIYYDEEITTLIKKTIEGMYEKDGYLAVEEIESILERPIIEVVRSGVKIGSNTYTLAGKGTSDLDEPLLQQKVLAGTGSNKQVAIYLLSHFLLEFEEDKKYVMQNEIRRLSNEVYRPRLQTVKEKLQGSVSGSEKKELEKQEKLLSEAVKTLESWNVVD